MQDFDMQEFLNQTQQDVPSADFVLTPPGDCRMYVKPGSTKIVAGEKDGRPWRLYTALAVVDDENARQATNLPQPTARIRFFLDLTEAGAIAKGVNKNVRLGQLLKATGNDRPGWSYQTIEGTPFAGRIRHVQNNDRVDAEVVTFTKA